MMAIYTHGGGFEGICGFSLAFSWAGFETKWVFDNNEYCQAVERRHFPDAEQLGDVFDIRNPKYVDVFTAGFPCQPFSSAGKGLGDKDERFLVPEMLRVISEVQPRVILLENVPRFATLDDGIYFRRLLRALAEMGYDAEWGYIRASDVGAPHRRERWFLVAYTNPSGYNRTNGRQRDNDRDGLRHGSTFERKRNHFASRISQNSQLLGNASIARLSYGRSARKRTRASEARAGVVTKSKRPGNVPNTKRNGRQRGYTARRGAETALPRSGTTAERISKPRLGRNAHGLPYRLDEPAWPAPPGPQFDGEPARTTDIREFRAQRVTAIGNAVVPQVVFSLAFTIRAWLESQDETKI